MEPGHDNVARQTTLEDHVAPSFVMPGAQKSGSERSEAAASISLPDPMATGINRIAECPLSGAKQT